MDKYITVDLTKTPKEILSYDCDTIPEYLINIEYSDMTNVTVYNLLTDIFTNNDTPFNTFYSNIKTNSKKNIDIKLALQIWLFLHIKRNQNDIKDFQNTMNIMYPNKTDEELFEDYFDDIITINFLNDIDKDDILYLKSNVNTIQHKIYDFKKNYKFFYDKFKSFRDTPIFSHDYSLNPLETLVEEDIFLTYYCTNKIITLDNIFNNIELNDSIPFCMYNNYIKVLKNFDIEKYDWLKKNFFRMDIDTLRKECDLRKIDPSGNKQFLIEKLIDFDSDKNENINYNQNSIILKYKNESSRLIYETISISVINNKIIMIVKTKEREKDNLLKTILSVIKSNDFEENPSETKFSGKMYIINKNTDLYLNKSILAHTIIMNGYAIFINEFANASTINKTTKLQYDLNNIIKTSIQNNIIQGNEKGILKDLPKERLYLQINISSCKNKNELLTYMNDLCRIIYKYYLYLDEYTTLYKYYNPSFDINYSIPKFKEVRDTSISSIITGKKTGDSWTSSCQPTPRRNIKYYPTELKEELTPIEGDYSEYFFEKDGKQYMLWPKKGDVRKGIEQHLFTCEDVEYKYPGLLKGNTQLPCCFKNQFSNTKSYYLLVENKKDNQDYILTTESKLDVNKRGVILNPKILYIVGEDSLRFGVNDGNYSFLACIMFYKKNQTIIPTKEKIKDELKKIINSSINTSFQSNYNLEKDEIIKNIISDKYFDPRLYTFLLESFYKVNIITFDKENDGNVIMSNNTNGDLFYKYPNTVFVFENSKNNQKNCEYIKTTKVINNPIQYKLKYFSNNKRIEPFNKIEYYKYITCQSLDNFGKCRIINIKYKNGILQAHTFIPPLDIDIKPISFITNKLNILLDFLIDNSFKIISQYSIGDVTYELKCKDTSNNILYFKLNCNKLNRVKISKNKFIVYYENNFYDQFVYNKKISKILKEHAIWIFSKSGKNLSEFEKNINHYMVEIKNHVYPIVNTINMNNGFFQTKDDFINTEEVFEENKLIIGSKNPPVLKKRLLQYIKLYSIRFPENTKNYSNRQVVSNFFENIRDFKTYVNQYLVFFNKTIPKQNNNISIVSNISNDNISNEPYLYFFKAKLFLAQDCESLKSSLYISENWYYNLYNYKSCDKNFESTKYNLYNISEDIIKFSNEKNPNIIKVNNNKFVSLLPF